jgi:hypothetical protein
MWILPKQLHTLASVRDTEALSLDLNESSQLCAQSLFVRSKPSLLRTWLQKWKRDSWTQHLFGRILRPSLGKAFEIEFTSSLVATHASPSAQQASELGQMTHDTCGHTSQKVFAFSSQPYAYLKTSTAILRWDSPQLSVIWKKWVTKCRGAYSQRLNAARLTSGSASSSWPTIRASEYKGCGPLGSKSHIYRVSKFYLDAVAQDRTGQTGRLNPSWCEWLMGVPIGWTGCASLATESCPLQQH